VRCPLCTLGSLTRCFAGSLAWRWAPKSCAQMTVALERALMNELFVRRKQRRPSWSVAEIVGRLAPADEGVCVRLCVWEGGGDAQCACCESDVLHEYDATYMVMVAKGAHSQENTGKTTEGLCL